MIKIYIIFPQYKLLSLLTFCFIISVLSCNSYHRNQTHSDISLSSIKAGEVLAETYCQSCHLLPEPSLLDSKSWEKGVLPQMGPRLGIFSFGFDIYHRVRDKNISPAFYPSQPLVSLAEW